MHRLTPSSPRSASAELQDLLSTGTFRITRNGQGVQVAKVAWNNLKTPIGDLRTFEVPFEDATTIASGFKGGNVFEPETDCIVLVQRASVA